VTAERAALEAEIEKLTKSFEDLEPALRKRQVCLDVVVGMGVEAGAAARKA
jgi:hypothetical protein